MMGTDKYQRPVVYAKTIDLNLAATTPEQHSRLIMFIMDYTMSLMPAHAD